MKFCIVLILFLMSAFVQANDRVKVALLTSLDPQDGKKFYHGKSYSNHKNFEKKFLKHFDANEFEVVVIHYATLTEVWNTLHDESISAVFFISHAGLKQSGSQGVMEAPSMIADFNGNDIKNAFQKVHPNLKYLAVIGCNSESIINDFRELKTYTNAPDLKITTFDYRVRAMAGLKTAINESMGIIAEKRRWCKYRSCRLSALKTDRANEVRDEKANLILTREIPGDVRDDFIRPTLVMKGKKVLAFFPKGQPGDVQEVEISERFNKKETLINDSGLSSKHKKAEVILGELKVNFSEQNCELAAERNRQGEIMGIGKHFYKLKCDNKENL